MKAIVELSGETIHALDDAFTRSINKHIDEYPEIKALKDLYENKSAVNYTGQNLGIEEVNTLFRSGILAMMTQLRASMLVGGRPRFYGNPVLTEDAEEKFMKMLTDRTGEDGKITADEELTAWMIESMDENGGPAGMLNAIVDDILNEWWLKSSIKTVRYITMKDGSLAPKTWVKIYESPDEKLPISKRVMVKHVKWEDVCEDPDATTEDERRYIFHYKITDAAEVEREYKLEKGSLNDTSPEHRTEGVIANPNPFDLRKKPELKRVILVEGYIKNKAIEGLPDNARGTIVTFVLGQQVDGQEESDILVLSVQKNKYRRFPLIDFVPDPETEIIGRPLARDVGPFNMIGDMVMQRGLANFISCGIARFFGPPNILADTPRVRNMVAEYIATEDNVQFFLPQNVSAEGTSLFQQILGISEIITGLSPSIQGRAEGRVESGKAISQLQNIGNLRLGPVIQQTEVLLTKIMEVFSDIILNVVRKGDVVRSGAGLKNRRVLPFDLSEYIGDFDIIIGQESLWPRNREGQQQAMMEVIGLAAKSNLMEVAVDMLLDVLDVEDRDKYMKKITDSIGAAQQIEQAGQAIQQLQQQLQAAAAQIEKMAQENGDMKLAIKAGELKAMYQMAMQDKKDQTSMSREQERTNQRLTEVEAKMTEVGVKASLESRKLDIAEKKIDLDAVNKETGGSHS